MEDIKAVKVLNEGRTVWNGGGEEKRIEKDSKRTIERQDVSEKQIWLILPVDDDMYSILNWIGLRSIS